MSKFYQAKDKIIAIPNEIEDVTITIDNEPLEEVIPNTKDAAVEKHVPVVKVDGNTVTVNVGEAMHPMEDVHYIEEIYLDTNKGNYKKTLKPGQEPVVTFTLDEDETPESVYSYCNIHGLWEKAL